MGIVTQLFQNATLIISLVFLSLKVRDFLLDKKDGNESFLKWLGPLFSSLLSISVMMYPFTIHGMRFDLRTVPIFFAAYIGGWQWGLSAVILPAVYRLYLGGDTAWVGIVNWILLAAVIGSLLSPGTGNSVKVFSLRRMILSFLVFSIANQLLNFIALGFTSLILNLNLNVALFSTLALLGLGIMVNDSNRTMRYQRELKYRSQHDQKTDLLTLEHFKDNAKQIAKGSSPFSIAMLDIDYFKIYNDAHGHPAGDIVLTEIGSILKDSVRQGDLTGRFGGEEFIILLNGVFLPETVIAVCERIRQSVEQYEFAGRQSQPGGLLTVSIGVCCSSGDGSLDEMIKRADEALYEAKNQGRNRVSLRSCA